MPEKQKLIHGFLIEEYKHASEYSLTILKDRTQIYTLYVALFAAVSLANTQLYINHPNNFELFIAIVLFFYSLVNFFSFTHFATLEATYVDSISRMDDIRQCYNNLLINDPGKNTLFGKDLRETCENELEQGDLHHLMWLYHLFWNNPEQIITIKSIFSVENRKFIYPTTKLRPTNRAICIWYTVLEVASLWGFGIFLYRFLSSQHLLVAADVAVHLGVPGLAILTFVLLAINYHYYCSVNKVCKEK